MEFRADKHVSNHPKFKINFFASQKPLLKIRLRSFASQKPVVKMQVEPVSCIMDSTSYLKKPRSFNSSGVENTWIRDWYLNAFSLDQIGQLKASANAKYCTSFSCGANGEASSAYSLN